MRVRLFWQLLATFALLIVFGVGGTAALIGVQFWQITSQRLPATLEANQHIWVALLADYYVAHGGSWAGVEGRLDALLAAEGWFPEASIGYGLLDANGELVAQGGAAYQELLRRQPASMTGAPIMVNDLQVGTLLLLPATRERGGWPWRGSMWHEREPVEVVPAAPELPAALEPARLPDPPDVERQIRRSFPLAALGIGSITLGLAVIMSRRISAPLARLTQAARRVAAGDLRVAVPGSSILEVDMLARAFNQMATDLAHEDQLRRNMTADIAHELRTPLTIIKGKLEGILDGVYPAAAEHIGPVLEEATLLERLVDDLRLLSLAESGQLPLYREEVVLSELLHTVGRAFAGEAAQRRVTLSVDVAAETPPVEVDPQRLQQVLGNLLANSLRHTPPGGQIWLQASAREQMARIKIRDTGHGIAPDELPHIFDRFWRGDKARTRHGSGAGLGLAIARQLVEAHGGHIGATSRPGQGTTITIDLPTSGARG